MLRGLGFWGGIVIALVVAALVLFATGGSPTSVLSALLDGSVRGPGRWGTTIGVASLPLGAQVEIDCVAVRSDAPASVR